MSRPDDPARPVGLDAVLTTGDLARRPSRPPDHAAEARALAALAEMLGSGKICHSTGCSATARRTGVAGR